jgi:CRP-like cAMP-binding protein
MDFVQGKPELTEKITQYMIASYLGITPEGLSRIKKRVS